MLVEVKRVRARMPSWQLACPRIIRVPGIGFFGLTVVALLDQLAPFARQPLQPHLSFRSVGLTEREMRTMMVSFKLTVEYRL